MIIKAGDDYVNTGSVNIAKAWSSYMHVCMCTIAARGDHDTVRFRIIDKPDGS